MRQKHLFQSLTSKTAIGLFFQKKPPDASKLPYRFYVFRSQDLTIKLIIWQGQDKEQNNETIGLYRYLNREIPTEERAILPLGVLWVVPKKIKKASSRNLIRRRLKAILAKILTDEAGALTQNSAPAKAQLAVVYNGIDEKPYSNLLSQWELLWPQIRQKLRQHWVKK